MHETLRRTLASLLVASLAAGCQQKPEAAPAKAASGPPPASFTTAPTQDEGLFARRLEPPSPAPEPAARPALTNMSVERHEQARTQENNSPMKSKSAKPGALGGIGSASGAAYGYGIGAGSAAVSSRAARAPTMRPPVPVDPQGSEDYAHLEANKMTLTSEDHLSTFAVDVDTASYAITRRKLLDGQAVPPEAVRVEEFVNYFKYGYEGPSDGRPFAVHLESAPSPFTTGRTLLRVGVQGKQVAKSQRKPAHLVFLVDVSGSMAPQDRLPLAQRSLRILVDNLGENDTVALVTYAGSTRVVLPPTGLDKRAEIHAAIDSLTSGGSTAMASGIELAYSLALKSVKPGSESRVVILSDGDANVGATKSGDLLATIAGHVKEGVTLSTIGFGMGNYKDSLMEQLANKGNGNNYYIDSLSQAKRVFQEQLGGTLEVIAQDVKIQVDFDPGHVKAYRLIGYENRNIADQDFRDDKVDAGEIGAGHAVTAIYELELGSPKPYHAPLATVRIRAKKPRGKEAAEHTYPLSDAMRRQSFAEASEGFRFAAAVAGFAEILRKSPYAEGWTFAKVLSIAHAAIPAGNEERSEFVALVSTAMRREGSR